MGLIKVGQIVTGQGRLEVLSIGEKGMDLLVLEADPHLETYLDVGKIYTAVKHSTDTYELWEIPGEIMRCDSSQALIYAWDSTKAEIELDF